MKASGRDYIPPDVLKTDIVTGSRVLHPLFLKKFPLEWKEGH